jgi:hypothetical protein
VFDIRNELTPDPVLMQQAFWLVQPPPKTPTLDKVHCSPMTERSPLMIGVQQEFAVAALQVGAGVVLPPPPLARGVAMAMLAIIATRVSWNCMLKVNWRSWCKNVREVMR